MGKDKKVLIEKLRELMSFSGVSTVIIPQNDYHSDEYVSDYFKLRDFFSGFTGSNGTLVVNMSGAYLWTDGRYFVQAKEQLAGSDIELMRMADKGVPTILEFLAKSLKKGDTLGFDGKLISYSSYIQYENICKKNKVSINRDFDVTSLWINRPKMVFNDIFYLPIEYSGETISSKLKKIRKAIKEENADGFLFTKLDDIMWLLNIRGTDIDYNMVAYSYCYVNKQDVVLFVDVDSLKADAKTALIDNGVLLKSYDDVYSYFSELSKKLICADYSSINASLALSIKDNNIIKECTSPITILKACKNKTEIKHIKDFYLKDSVALTKFIYKLKTSVKNGNWDEINAAECLDKMRSEIPGFLELSFGTISAYGANAAMMHYEPTSDNFAKIEPKGFYLVDSGAHYYGATTDVTRTIAVGALTDEEKKSYTLSAKGMLKLLNARFLYGCTGRNLDILARESLWEQGIDYKCGTGHGIGYCLNVHEGPQNIRWKFLNGMKEVAIEPGMLVSDEPGVYIEGKYGIRIENILVSKSLYENEYGKFMGFDNLTYVPLELDAIDYSLLNEDDIKMLKDYCNSVKKALSPFLTEEEKAWLAKECKVKA